MKGYVDNNNWCVDPLTSLTTNSSITVTILTNLKPRLRSEFFKSCSSNSWFWTHVLFSAFFLQWFNYCDSKIYFTKLTVSSKSSSSCTRAKLKQISKNFEKLWTTRLKSTSSSRSNLILLSQSCVIFTPIITSENLSVAFYTAKYTAVGTVVKGELIGKNFNWKINMVKIRFYFIFYQIR